MNYVKFTDFSIQKERRFSAYALAILRRFCGDCLPFAAHEIDLLLGDIFVGRQDRGWETEAYHVTEKAWSVCC